MTKHRMVALVNFLPRGITANSDRCIETIRSQNARLCRVRLTRSVVPLWQLRRTPVWTSERPSRMLEGQCYGIHCPYHQIINCLILKESLREHLHGNDGTLQKTMGQWPQSGPVATEWEKILLGGNTCCFGKAEEDYRWTLRPYWKLAITAGIL